MKQGTSFSSISSQQRDGVVGAVMMTPLVVVLLVLPFASLVRFEFESHATLFFGPGRRDSRDMTSLELLSHVQSGEAHSDYC
jgi:hypothetical protein